MKTDYDPKVKKKSCTTEKNVIQFKLNERFAQDVFYAGGIGKFVEPTFNLNLTSLTLSDASTVKRTIKVRAPPSVGQMPDTDFDTLYTAVFTLHNQVHTEKEVWFIQDKGDFESQHKDPTTEQARGESSSGDGDSNTSDEGPGARRLRGEEGRARSGRRERQGDGQEGRRQGREEMKEESKQ